MNAEISIPILVGVVGAFTTVAGVILTRLSAAKNSGVDMGRLIEKVDEQGKTLAKLSEKLDNFIGSSARSDERLGDRITEYIVIHQQKIEDSIREHIRLYHKD
jgi:hypothetical protein